MIPLCIYIIFLPYIHSILFRGSVAFYLADYGVSSGLKICIYTD